MAAAFRSAAARRFQDEDVACAQVEAGDAGKRFARAVAVLDPLPARRARLAAFQAEAADPAAQGEQVAVHGLQEADAPLDAVAARYRPAPPEPRRMAKRSTRTGKFSSMTSGSVRRELVMWQCTALAPAKVGPAPVPPHTVS